MKISGVALRGGTTETLNAEQAGDPSSPRSLGRDVGSLGVNQNKDPRIRTASQHILLARPDVLGVYGFGSFFRGTRAKDIDLLVLLRDSTREAGRIDSDLSNVLSVLGNEMNLIFDLTILTEAEFREELLLEQNALVELVRRQ